AATEPISRQLDQLSIDVRSLEAREVFIPGARRPLSRRQRSGAAACRAGRIARLGRAREMGLDPARREQEKPGYGVIGRARTAPTGRPMAPRRYCADVLDRGYPTWAAPFGWVEKRWSNR